MNHKWDSTGIQTNVELWSEVLRVLKPGGHMLQFSSQRTYHRMQVQIEDSGFNIKDMIEWIYSSGMPKGSNISKQIDKKLGKEPAIIGINPASRKNKPSNDIYEQGFRGKTQYITEQTSEEQKKWKGWNTQLKPQHEPICMQQKPLSTKTIVDNVLKWGTGQINIEQNKIPLKQEDNKDLRIITRNARNQVAGKYGYGFNVNKSDKVSVLQATGRFPQNLIFDVEQSKYLDSKVGVLTSGKLKSGQIRQNKRNVYNSQKPDVIMREYQGDSGGQSRFFNIVDIDPDYDVFYYNGKQISEREKYNNHPTLKPLKLIELLVKLVTPPNGIVLDPFGGSGTTQLQCIQNNFNYILIEINSEYVDIQNKRIAQYKELKQKENKQQRLF